jgi:hypothetical protein
VKSKRAGGVELYNVEIAGCCRVGTVELIRYAKNGPKMMFFKKSA